MKTTDDSPNNRHHPAGQPDQFRELIAADDPAALTGADVRDRLNLVQASMDAAGIR